MLPDLKASQLNRPAKPSLLRTKSGNHPGVSLKVLRLKVRLGDVPLRVLLKGFSGFSTEILLHRKLAFSPPKKDIQFASAFLDVLFLKPLCHLCQELRQLCKEHGLPVGKKNEMVERLVAFRGGEARGKMDPFLLGPTFMAGKDDTSCKHAAIVFMFF